MYKSLRIKHLTISQIILFLLIFYPLFYAIPFIAEVLEYKFSNYFFILILFLIVGHLSIIQIQKFNIKVLISSYFFMSILLLMYFNSTAQEAFKPIVFILYSLIFYVYLSTVSTKVAILRYIPTVMYIMLGVSILFLFDQTRYTSLGRYSGFAISPTTFTVFLDSIFIFYIFSNSKQKNKLIAFLLLLFFSLISETRLNTLFLLMLPVLYYLLESSNTKTTRSIILSGYIISLNLIYPLYNYYVQINDNNMFAQRYEHGTDSSFGLRYAMFTIVTDDISDSTIQEIFFGKGRGYARQLILEEYDIDLQPHNDFLRFLLDYGLFASFVFLTILFLLAIQNNLSTLISMLYFLAFYHNMIYSYYLISLVMIASIIYQKTLQEKRLSKIPILKRLI